MPKFPHYQQLDSMNCGPTCLRMIAKYYGKTYSLQYLRSRFYITREGMSMLGISEAAENIGFRTRGLPPQLGILTGSIISMIFPFLMQSIVDYGIANSYLALVELPGKLVLGELQEAYNRFYRNWNDYKDYVENDFLSQKIDLLRRQMKKQQQYCELSLQQEEILKI